MKVGIKAIEYYLPEKVLSNEDLAACYPQWTAQKIYDKTGIEKRHIAADDECVSDMAVSAADKLINSYGIDRQEIDFLLLATQSPDYFLPTTACLVHEQLELKENAGALDFNLGCSAYIYGLALSKALIVSGMANNVLLITSETYSKHIHPMDKSTRTIFGDAAAASLIAYCDNNIGETVMNTDGKGAENLIIPAGGMRLPRSAETTIEHDDGFGSMRSANNLYMNGTAIFNFTSDIVPRVIAQTLEDNKLNMDDIDLFVFHQANAFMLEYLRKKMKIEKERFYINLSCGNTVSSTIPIALKNAGHEGRIHSGMKVLVAGFGVGYSWGASVITY